MQMEKNYKDMLEDTVRKRTQELADALQMVKNIAKEVTARLTTVAEYRDTNTGAHISRIGLYSNKIAEALACRLTSSKRSPLPAPCTTSGRSASPTISC